MSKAPALPNNRPTQTTKVNTILRRFARDETGTLVVFGVYVFVLILMVAGIGVDLMRFERDRANLQYTLDRAVLAAADLEQPLNPTAVVNDYMNKAGLSQYLTGVDVVGDSFSRRVSANVSSQMETMFMNLTGTDFLASTSRSVALESVPNIEISLVLDISGSMAVNGRVELMKPAAKEFVSTVLARNVDGNTGTVNAFQTSVSVVPFAGQTNPGEEMFEYLGGERFGTTTSEDYFPEWGQDISNIVFWFDTTGDGELDYSAKIEGYPDIDVDMFNKDDLDEYYLYAIEYIERLNPSLEGKMEMIGATIKGGKEPTSFYSITGETIAGPTTFNNVDLEINFNDFYSGLVPNNVSSCIEMEYSDFYSTGLPTASIDQVAHFVNWDYDEVTQNWGWCPDDGMRVQYAQKSEEVLHDVIDTIRLHDGTGTNYGMKYALALLDPATQPAFEHLSATGIVPAEFSNRPLSWNAEQSAKYIVLMTDGRTSLQVRPSETLEIVNTETELTARPAEDTVVESSNLSNLELFHMQCEMAKSMGVTIYTVAFETSDIAAAEVMECASSPAHFFEVTGAEVIDTFVSIASSIQRLRLIE